MRVPKAASSRISLLIGYQEVSLKDMCVAVTLTGLIRLYSHVYVCVAIIKKNSINL